MALLGLGVACFAQTDCKIPRAGRVVKQILSLITCLLSTVDVSRKDGGLHLLAGRGWQDRAIPHALCYHQPQVAATP